MESLQAANTSNSTQDANTVTESLDEDSTPDNAPTHTTASQVKPPAAQPPTPKPSPVAAVAAPQVRQASLPLTPASNPDPTAVSGPPVMVQIAAVSRSEDANALASALRQRGYNVAVRNEHQDNLLHVQVGPFTSRDEAKAMRSKLMADGYNAILKP